MLFVTTLTALAAQISVPLPFTAGAVHAAADGRAARRRGARRAPRAASQVLYLSLGLAGLPVFAASPLLPQGAARLIGPTGGFLLSYPLAAWVTGWLAERRFDRKYLTSLAAMAAGLAVIFAGGVGWLAFGAAPSVSAPRSSARSSRSSSPISSSWRSPRGVARRVAILGRSARLAGSKNHDDSQLPTPNFQESLLVAVSQAWDVSRIAPRWAVDPQSRNALSYFGRKRAGTDTAGTSRG